MNLTTDPWIPVVWESGKPDLISLRDAFEHGKVIRDLAVRPHERIALMRLLICTAQAALDGPADYDDLQSCQPRINPAAVDYLMHWREPFELFGDGQRFLQVSRLQWPAKKPVQGHDEGNIVTKLDLVLATGNATVFDNAGGSERAFTLPRLVVNLLSYQCYSPGGRIGLAIWNGSETPGNGSSKHAPCIAGSMLHTILRGGNLATTIHLNLLTKMQVDALFGSNRWGRPLWEAFPQSSTDLDAISNAS